MSQLRLLFVVLVLAVFPLSSSAELAVPQLKGPVMDLSGTLTDTQIESLATISKAFEAQKGGQIVVLMIPMLEGTALEDYSLKVAETWKIGRKGSDDGVLLLIAKFDRKLRIEVGYGYEGALTDVESNRIIREIITPKFKEGDFYGGIQDGLNAIIGQVNGEELPPPQSKSASNWTPEGSTIEIYIIGVMVFVSLTGALRKSLGRFPAALVVGAIACLFLLIFVPFVVAGVVGAISFVLSLFYDQLGGSNGVFGGRSSSGGFRSSGGGYSGGGGSFGGGGSSGSW